ncbi:MAG: translocation/assembly module TamB domain-containing protein [candidate division Zixibacteria bacterium]|nr:translocation/assembly module TamB domain-containing protein [candidate division Zixibacteria bacterium]
MRKRFKIPLLTILIVICLILLCILILANTKILENRASYTINTIFLKKYPLKVKIGDIGGDILNNISLRNLSIDYIKPNKAYRIVQIDEVKAAYNFVNLLGRRWKLDLLEIYNPQIDLSKFEQPKSPSASRQRLPNFNVDDIRIIGGEIKFLSGGKEEKINILNLRLALSHQDDNTEVDILQGGASSFSRKISIKTLEGKLNYSQDILDVANFHLVTPQLDISLKGRIVGFQKPTFSFELDIPKLDFEELNRIMGTKLLGNIKAKGTCSGGLHKFEGEMQLDGKFFEKDFDGVSTRYLYADKILTLEEINGKVFKSPIYGNGLIDFNITPQEYQLKARIKNLDINRIVPTTTFHTDLSGEVSLFGQSFSEDEFIMDIQADLGRSRIDLYSFDQLQGDFSVTASDIFFFRGFMGRYKNTRFVFNGDIEYDNRLNVESEIYFNDLVDFENQTFLGKIRGQGKADLLVFGKTLDFNVKGNFTSDSAYVYDLFSRDVKIDFGINNYIAGKDGQVDVQLLNGVGWAVPYDSIYGHLTLKGENLVIIDSAYFRNEYASAFASGNYNQSFSTPQLFFDQFKLDYRGNKIGLSQPLMMDIDKDLVRVGRADFSADGGGFWVSGRLQEDSLSLKAGFDNIDINPWFSLFLPQKEVKGQLTGELEAGGSLDQPQMKFDGKIGQARFDKLDWGDLSASLEYKDTSFSINALKLSSSDGIYTFSGFMPIDLSLKYVNQRFPEKPQKINARFEGKKINILPYFVPDMEYLKGDFKGELVMTGTTLKPSFDGQMTIKNGILKLEKLMDPVENLEADMVMQGTDIDFTKIKGIVKHEVSSSDNWWKRLWHGASYRKPKYGTVDVSGKLNVKEINRFEYDFVFKGKDLPIRYEYADLSAVVDADLEIKGISPPLVSGDINISELYYKEPFGSSEGQLGGIGDSSLWNLNLDISADGQIFIMNYDMNAEFKGEVVISREKGKYTLLGEMEAVRGKYFLARTFNIDKGTMTFDNIEKIDPKLDFLLSTTVYTGDTLSFSEYNDIQLQVNGTLLSPEVSPVSGSPYSRGDIIQLLAIGYSPPVEDTSRAQTQLQNRLLNSLEGTIGALGSRALENWATNTIGLETFEIRPEQRGKFSLWSPEVTVGKYFANRFYVRYTFGPSQGQENRWSLEYRLSRHFLLEASRDREDKFHLGFNLSWDY